MPEAQSHNDPYAPFRPRLGRAVPITAAIVVFAAFTFAAITIPGANWTVFDRVFLFLIGVAGTWFLTRFVGIEARPSPEGLVIRNLFRRRHLEWSQVLGVQFGGGLPWAYLDTTDAETVPVMGIQKADGRHAHAEAARLAALIEFHSGAAEPEPRQAP